MGKRLSKTRSRTVKRNKTRLAPHSVSSVGNWRYVPNGPFLVHVTRDVGDISECSCTLNGTDHKKNLDLAKLITSAVNEKLKRDYSLKIKFKTYE